ncbi:MAG: glycosyltransferase family 4 protein [Candidatus Micrarchaeaceae archaeon]
MAAINTRDSGNRRIRVANITEDGRYAGPQRRIALVAAELATAHNIETVVIHPRHEAERLIRELKQHGIRSLPVPLHRFSRHPGDLVAAVALLPLEIARLTWLLRRGHFDIVHCNSSWQWKGAIAAKLARTPVIFHLNDTDAPPSVMKLFRRVAKSCAEGFIVAGERVRDYYLTNTSLSDRPIYEIQAPVLCDDLAVRGHLPPGNTVEKHTVRIITLANVNPLKDIETLIRAAAALRAIRPALDAVFFVYGGLFPSQQKYIVRLQSLMRRLGVSNVHLAGPTDQVVRELAAADIYLCTSRSEASPMAIWEAAAAGLPVVSTDVGDVCKFNATCKFAITAPVGDADSLGAALLELAENPEKRKELGANGQKLARSEFDLPVCAERHADAYRSLLTQLRSGS